MITKILKRVYKNTKVVTKRAVRKGGLLVRSMTYRPKKEKFTEGLQDVVDVISYSSLQEQQEYLMLNGKYLRVMMLVGYPYLATTNWLYNLINFASDIDISYHIERLEPTAALSRLTRKITELETTRRGLENQGKMVGEEIMGPLESAMTLRDKLVRAEERMFQLSIYAVLGASTLEELDKVTKMLEAELGAAMFVSKKAILRQLDGLQSILPRAENVLGQRRNMDTSTLALTLPFVSSELVYEDGILFGINKTNNSLVILDRFALNNANSITFAQSGAGKSYTTKVEILRQLMLGCEVIVIDPEGEYKDVCKKCKGTYIELSASSAQTINPFSVPLEITLEEHLAQSSQLFELLCEAQSASERAAVERSVIAIYKDCGWTMVGHRGTKTPLVKDLYQKLQQSGQGKLADRLGKYVEGALQRMFARDTNVELKNRLVVFDISNVAQQARPVMMTLIANFVNGAVRAKLKRRLLVIDEGWLVLESEQSAKYFAALTRRARKYYLGVNIITQQANDFLNNEYGQTIASQASLRVLLRQDTTSIDKVVEQFGLSETEEKYLLTAGRGEALILADGNHALVKIVASEAEHPLITTDPSERE